MPRIRDLFRKLLGWGGHVRLSAHISFVFTHIDALDCKVRFDILQVLVLVQSDLHSAGAGARALHPVLVQPDLDDVTSAGHLLDCLVVRVRGQTAQLELDNLGGVICTS